MMRDDVEIIVFWSERMYDLTRALAHTFSNTWFMEKEDLTQEAYLAIAYWIKVKGDEPVTVKLFTSIVKNRFHVFLRKHKNERKRIPETCAPERVTQNDNTDIKLDILDVLKSIPEHLRHNVESQYHEFKTLAELAEEESLTKHGIHQRNTKAYRKMREKLNNGYGPDDQRKCVQNRWKARKMTGRHMNWLKWGRIPNQRNDDDA